MTDFNEILNDSLNTQDLSSQPVLSLDQLNALRLRIVEEDYDPTHEEMAAVIQTIRPMRQKDSEPKEKKPRGKKAPVQKVDLDDLL